MGPCSDGCCGQPKKVDFVHKPTLVTALYVAKYNLARRPEVVIKQSTTYMDKGPEIVS